MKENVSGCFFLNTVYSPLALCYRTQKWAQIGITAPARQKVQNTEPNKFQTPKSSHYCIATATKSTNTEFTDRLKLT